MGHAAIFLGLYVIGAGTPTTLKLTASSKRYWASSLFISICLDSSSSAATASQVSAAFLISRPQPNPPRVSEVWSWDFGQLQGQELLPSSHAVTHGRVVERATMVGR